MADETETKAPRRRLRHPIKLEAVPGLVEQLEAIWRNIGSWDGGRKPE